MSDIGALSAADVIALLRELPRGSSWPAVTRELLAGQHDVTSIRTALGLDSGPVLWSDGEQHERASADLARWTRDGILTLLASDERYPLQLLDVAQAPPILFARGTLHDKDLGVAVVGTREPSAEGRLAAQQAARLLVERQMTVVSGLALGIDTAAHEATLEAGGRAVAILGNGLETIYPAVNRDLASRIERQGGLLLSQFWPESRPTRQSFPMRNAIMSGYSIGSFIVEASAISGTRIQARLAVEHGRAVFLNEPVLANEWARKLVGRPGVRVVQGPKSLARAIDDAMHDRSQLSSSRFFARTDL